MVNKYYQKHKEILRKEVRKRYKILSEEEKDKRQKKVQDRYQNLSGDEKEKSRQYHRERNNNPSEEPEERLVTSSRSLLLFIILYIKGYWAQKKK